MHADDLTRLKHMRDAAQELVEFAQGRTSADLASGVLFARGVMKTIEIVGEAASRVTKISQSKFPAIPRLIADVEQAISALERDR